MFVLGYVSFLMYNLSPPDVDVPQNQRSCIV